MSDEIQLSPQLFQDIQQAIAKVEPSTDPGVTLQYLAAVMGYMLGSEENLATEQKRAFFEQLCGFAEHVMQDTDEQVQKHRQSQTQSQQQAPQGNAFGYWEPPRKN